MISSETCFNTGLFLCYNNIKYVLEKYLEQSKIVVDYKKVNFDFLKNNNTIDTLAKNEIIEADKIFDVYVLYYKVEDLKVKGFITLPKKIDFSGKNKTAICLRGGHDDFGSLLPGYTIDRKNLYSILPNLGYITFYTQYRGLASGEGFDEYGGKDINDILVLFDLIKEFEFCDKEKIVVMGSSRGGMMLYQLLAKDLPISKAVIIGGISNMQRSLTDGWRKGWRDYFIKKKFFDIENQDELDKRSAVSFYANIKKIPILLIHGTSDKSVRFQDSVDINKLIPQSKLVLYEDDDHSISKNRTNLKQQISEFLEK